MNTSNNYPSNLLFTAQKEAYNAINCHLFPRYVPDGTLATFSCNAVHDTLYCVEFVIQKIKDLGNAILSGFDWALEKISKPLLNTIHPINPVNGERHFTLIPRSIEKVFGEYLFLPLAMGSLSLTKEKVPYKQVALKTFMDRIVHNIIEKNETILNPPGDTPFEYEAYATLGQDLNAFAVPGGKMVVFSQAIKEIAESLSSNSITKTTVYLHDGTTATVNLTGLSLEDVTASLLAHEITHIASRHGVASLLLKGPIKNALPTYAEPLIDSFRSFLELFQSRAQEIEADVTGAFLAFQSGYDPRGALYLQQLLLESSPSPIQVLYEHLETLQSHPHEKTRLTALLSAIATFAPKSLHGKVDFTSKASSSYDMAYASPGVISANRILNTFSS